MGRENRRNRRIELVTPSGLEITAEMVEGFPVRKGPCEDDSLGYMGKISASNGSNSGAKALIVIEALRRGATAIYMVRGSHQSLQNKPVFTVYGDAYKPKD